MHQINPNATVEDATLDALIESTTREQWRIRDDAARLHEQRLTTRLRAIFPAGGTAVVEEQIEDGDTDLGSLLILDPNGVEYRAADSADSADTLYGPDVETLIGADACEAIMADLRGIHYAKASRWSYGRGTFTF